MAKHRNKQYYDEAGLIIIKPYRLIDLITIFDVKANTFKKWIEPYKSQLQKDGRQYYTVQQVQFMIDKFGLPHKVIRMENKSQQKAA